MIGLIWAQAANGVVGRDNAIPWHLPEDLAHFRRITTGSTVVMGRRTWDSLPARFRPLPGRRNVVLTRSPDWSAEGAEVVHTLDDALRGDALTGDALTGDALTGDVWVIGGADVWAAALPLADVVELTELQEDFDGDVHAPVLDGSWQVETEDPEHGGWYVSSTGLRYHWLRYRRRPA